MREIINLKAWIAHWREDAAAGLPCTETSLSDAERAIAHLSDALDACEAYFDNRADLSDGDYGTSEPNEEMRLLAMIQSVAA